MIEVDESDVYGQYASQIQTISCRLLHGSYSWAAQLSNQLISKGANRKLEHWFCVIKTNRGYYCAQVAKDNNGLSGVFLSSRYSSRQNAISTGLCAKNDDHWTQNTYSGDCNIEMRLILKHIKRYPNKYSLSSNNCQHFCQTLASKFLYKKPRPRQLQQDDRAIHFWCQIM